MWLNGRWWASKCKGKKKHNYLNNELLKSTYFRQSTIQVCVMLSCKRKHAVEYLPQQEENFSR